jgi:tRNA (cytidine/uridine-2'-O-)-methyltransferase
MTLHVALIEPQTPPTTGNVMRLCGGADVPLHLIGPIAFDLAASEATGDVRDAVDLWDHPDWFAFRDAISRDRCIYFTADARVDYVKAPFKTNSVLVFGNEKSGMPARIVEKHRQRCYRLPAGGFASAVSTVLYEGLKRLGKDGKPPVFDAEAAVEDEEPNFNVAPPAVPVPQLDEPEEEDEINYNVEQKPRVSPHAGWGPRGGAGRGGPHKAGGPKAGAPKGPPGPRGGGRPRRGRGGRGRPKP